MTRLTTGLWIKKYPTSDVQFLIEIMLWSLAIHFPNELDSIGMNADLSDPVKFHALSFSNISGTLSNLIDFLRITWDRNLPSFATDEMMTKWRKPRLDSLQYGITLYISSEIVSIVNFRIWWDHCVKSSFRNWYIHHHFSFPIRDEKIKQQFDI